MSTNLRNETLSQRVATIIQKGRTHPTKSSQEIADEVLALVDCENIKAVLMEESFAPQGCTGDPNTCLIAYCNHPKCDLVPRRPTPPDGKAGQLANPYPRRQP